MRIDNGTETSTCPWLGVIVQPNSPSRQCVLTKIFAENHRRPVAWDPVAALAAPVLQCVSLSVDLCLGRGAPERLQVAETKYVSRSKSIDPAALKGTLGTLQFVKCGR